MAEPSVLTTKLDRTRVRVSAYPLTGQLAAIAAKEYADELRGLLNAPVEIVVDEVAIRRCAEYFDALDPPATIGVVRLLTGDGSAAIRFDRSLADIVADISMGGDPYADSPPLDRAPTAIDLALCGRVAHAAIDAYSRAVMRVCDGVGLGVMALDRFETTPKMARIATDRSEVLVIRLTADIGRGSRRGSLDIVTPLAVLDPVKDLLRKPFRATASANSALWESALKRGVAQAELPLEAVIDRSSMPLRRLLELRPGDVLPLADASLEEVALTIATRSGPRRIATCRLGALKSHKAVRLVDDPDPALTGALDQLLRL